MIHTHQSLFYTDGSSDRQYDLMIEENDGIFTASGRWGRRGNLAQSQVWYNGSSLADAQKVLEKKRAAKVAKGYTPGESGVPFEGIGDADGAHSGILPMLLTPITMGASERYLDDTSFCLQQKFDGERRLVEISADGTVRGVNRRGLYVALPQDIAAEFAAVPGVDHVIDGELVDGRFHAFDLVRVNGDATTNTPYRERLTQLRALLEGHVLHTLVLVARTETTTDGKREFFELLQALGAEGGVFKDLGSGLTLGARSTHSFKCKFWESATCEVEGLNEQRSIRLRMAAGSDPVSVGNCTIPVNRDVPPIGTFVEIRYLYAYRGGSLYQPQYLGVRNDVTFADCDVAQLKYKGEAEAA